LGGKIIIIPNYYLFLLALVQQFAIEREAHSNRIPYKCNDHSKNMLLRRIANYYLFLLIVVNYLLFLCKRITRHGLGKIHCTELVYSQHESNSSSDIQEEEEDKRSRTVKILGNKKKKIVMKIIFSGKSAFLWAITETQDYFLTF